MSGAALTFPNRARSYDALRHRIRFLGYDGMFEVPFFVEVGAIHEEGSVRARSEQEHLAAFDSACSNIIDVARTPESGGAKLDHGSGGIVPLRAA